jgi:hypothetical protein
MRISSNARKAAGHTVAGGEAPPNHKGRMGAVRRLAAIPGGRRSKWVVLGFWVVVLAVAGPLAGKLNSAQQNDSSAWRPSPADHITGRSVFGGHHRTATAGSIKEVSRQGLDLAPGSGFEHLQHERTE